MKKTLDLIKNKYDKIENIKYINNGGPLGDRGYNNVINLLKQSNGEYVQMLFHDDILYPNKISEMMRIFVEDTEDEIGFITSKVDFIDTTGNYIDKHINNDNVEYTRMNGRTFGKMIMKFFSNYVGSPTAALYRKYHLCNKINDKYFIGYCKYWGVTEKVAGDISVNLDICRKKDFVYIERPLSAFRFSNNPEQNTNNPDINIGIFIMWYTFPVLAWTNDDFFDNIEEFYKACDICNIRYSYKLLNIEQLLRNEENIERKQNIEFLIICHKYISNNEYDKFYHHVISYIISHNGCDLPILNKCQFDKDNNLWRKRFR